MFGLDLFFLETQVQTGHQLRTEILPQVCPAVIFSCMTSDKTSMAFFPSAVS